MSNTSQRAKSRNSTPASPSTSLGTVIVDHGNRPPPSPEIKKLIEKMSPHRENDDTNVSLDQNSALLNSMEAPSEMEPFFLASDKQLSSRSVDVTNEQNVVSTVDDNKSLPIRDEGPVMNSTVRHDKNTGSGLTLPPINPAGSGVTLPPINTAVIVPKNTGEKLTGVARFRRIARMVKTNVVWARDVREQYEDDNAFVVKGDDSPDAEALVFNVANFKVTHNAYGGLSKAVIFVLSKHPTERTDSDVSLLTDVVTRLQCFNKYSSAAKQELARIIFYETFEDGRVVIQEGHIGFSFYFIISGKVSVRVGEIDKKTGEKHMRHLGELSDGSSFGELALLHNIRRTATIVCKTACEFLRVDKSDFESVLRAVTQSEYERRLSIMKEFPAFSNWTLAEILDANYTTRIKECPPNMVLSNLDASDNFYVIICGESCLIRELYVLKEFIPWGGYRLRLPTEKQIASMKQTGMAHSNRTTDSTNSQRRTNVYDIIPERRLWTMGKLERFAYFGVGETWTDSHIISRTKVDLLMVPKLLFSKLGRSRTLDLMKGAIIDSLPTNQFLFHKYHRDLNWRRYRANLIEQIIEQRTLTTNTQLSDVPCSIRMDSYHKDHEF